MYNATDMRFLFVILFILFGCATKKRECPGEDKRRNWTSRPLEVFEKIFDPVSLKTVIFQSLRNGSGTILEFGTGEGRVLIELQKEFKKAEFFGINETYYSLMCTDDDFVRTGLYYGVLLPAEAKQLRNIPKIIAHDADRGDLPKGLPSFDVIFSQYSIRYIEEKQDLLISLWNHLKVGGTMLLEVRELHAFDQKGKVDLDVYMKKIFPSGAEVLAGVSEFETETYKSSVPWVIVKKIENAEAVAACRRIQVKSQVRPAGGGVESHYDCGLSLERQ